jgi:hypothetical protein
MARLKTAGYGHSVPMRKRLALVILVALAPNLPTVEGQQPDSGDDANTARQDPIAYVPAVVKRFPKLSVLVFESRQHHVMDDADDPQAVAQVAAWIDAGAHWVRFNPDSHYVEAMMGKMPPRVIQHPPELRSNEKPSRILWNRRALKGPTDKEGITAAVCELADRTHRNYWAPVLAKVLHH